jgi:6-phosphogluconolactonase
MSAAKQIYRWHYQADVNQLIFDLRNRIAALAEKSIKDKGIFTVVLAGGSTPKMLYQQLISLQTDWSCWRIYFGDERCLPVGHADRNDTMVKQAWLNHINIPIENIHSIHADKMQIGAVDYSALVNQVTHFDLVLLGLGEDGHTASLFPHDQSGMLVDSPVAVFIDHAPKPPSQRISLSAQRLGGAEAVWFLATGLSKREALLGWRAGESIPASTINCEKGVDIFTDQLFD